MRSLNLRRRFLQALAIGVLLWLALAAIPEKPAPLGTGVDASWQYGLNMAHQRGLVVGTGVVYTMGPLGYLMYPDPEVASSAQVLALLLTGYGLLLFGVLRCVSLAGLQAGALTAFVLGILTLYSTQYPDAWQAAVTAVLLAAAIPRYRFPILDLAVAGAASGLTLLLKFNDGVVLCAVFYVLLGRSWLRFRRHWITMWTALLPPVVLEAGMAAHGGAFAVVDYVRNTLHVARGYSEAMTFAGPFWQAALAACSVVAVLVLPLVLPEFRRLLPGLAAAAILCVAAFKHGMVRQDGHADLTQVKLAAAALFLFASATLPRTRRLYAALAIASTMVAVIICHREPERFAVKADSRATLRREIPSLLDLVTWQRTWAELGPANRARLAGLDLDARFRQVIGGGTVDAYPTRIDTVRANGWKYQPRPVLQSFVAYTPELDRLNAEHIAGPHAADYVVLQPDAVDGRNLMFDDPLSLRALLDHYRVVLSGSAALLLERRVGPPRFRAPEPLGAAVTGWVRSTPVPQVDPGEAVMMKVDIQRTLVGRLWLTLFRGAPVHLQAIRKTSGRTYARVVRANLASGVLVSPIARDIAELAAYFSGSAGLEPVVSIDWWTPGPSEFENDIRIEWFRLRPYLPATRTAVTEPSVSRTDPSVSRPER